MVEHLERRARDFIKTVGLLGRSQADVDDKGSGQVDSARNLLGERSFWSGHVQFMCYFSKRRRRLMQ